MQKIKEKALKDIVSAGGSQFFSFDFVETPQGFLCYVTFKKSGERKIVVTVGGNQRKFQWPGIKKFSKKLGQKKIVIELLNDGF